MNTEKNFQTYGKMAWLWSNSLLHRDWSVSQQAGFILPALACQQYYIVERDGFPVAYCSWALLDEESEAKYILNPNQLDPDSWTSGDRLWFIDWISPFSPKYTWALRSALVKRFPDKVARAMRVKKDNNMARIASFTGHGLEKAQSRKTKHQYYKEMVESLASNPKRNQDFFLSGMASDNSADFS